METNSSLDRTPRRPSDRGRLTLIVGLGNPGREHVGNRHNAGFQCIDHLAEAHGMSFTRRQARARVAQGEIGGRRVLLVKPQTFMNVSGEAVGQLARFYKIAPADVLVLYDDLDLPLGTIRLRPDGGSGGHRGMRSIIQHLGTEDFPRLRLGIGRPPGQMDPVDYVLSDFTADERAEMELAFEQAITAVVCFLDEGIDAAMNAFN
jgi:PTH1 family peptidyl-tRNA hydrolase